MDIQELNLNIQNNHSVEINEKQIKFIQADLQINQLGIKKISANQPIYSQFHIDPSDIKMLQEIGKGASSNVYRAVYTKNGVKQFVAVKSVCALEKKHRQQILSDLNTFFNSYSCPQLVTFYGCYYKDGSINQVLQLMDLGSLRKIITLIFQKKLKIPEAVLACIATNILKGLNYIHSSKQMIHRDIKPQNILLNSQGQIKISDFGISKKTPDTGTARTFVGTLLYMSPERVRPGASYTYLSDIWSFGLVMYELVTGDHPYKLTKDVPILQKIMQLMNENQPQLSQAVSPQFRDFISHCICKDLNKRCLTQKLLTHAWITKHEGNDKVLKEWIQYLIYEKLL